MRVKIFGILAISLVVMACRPDASSQYPEGEEPAAAPAEATRPAGPAAEALNNEVAADDPIHDAVIAAANTTLTEQVGQPVAIQAEIFRSEGEWAFVYGPVRNTDATEIDWSTTNLTAVAADGMMDGDLGVVLLNWSDGGWRVVEAVIGATDVPQGGWPAEHHVSAALVGMEGG
jgi:hypothetical protein